MLRRPDGEVIPARGASDGRREDQEEEGSNWQAKRTELKGSKEEMWEKTRWADVEDDTYVEEGEIFQYLGSCTQERRLTKRPR